MQKTIRVLMVEDHPDYREGIHFALETISDIDLYLTFGTAERALQSVQDAAPHLKPDVILLDLNLPGMSGIESIPWFKEYSPESHVLILSQSENESDILEATSAGASGYLLKNASLDEITDGIRTVLAGGASLDGTIAKFILSKIRNQAKPSEDSTALSEREMEVLVLIGEGLLKKEISGELKISVPTVATHVRHIYEKLGVQNAPAAITKAFRSGILPAE